MKKLLLLFAFAAVATAAQAQNSGGKLNGAPNDTIYVQKMPLFQGGNINKFAAWVAGRVRYPEAAVAGNVQGVVVVRFFVEPDGSVTGVEAVQSPHKLLSNEAVQVVRSSNKWTPASQGIKLADGTVIEPETPVRVRLVVPVQFAMAPQGEEALPGQMVGMHTIPARQAQPTFTGPLASWDDAFHKPIFQRGDHEKFAQWLVENVKLPKKAAKNGPMRMGVMFVVEPDGTVSGVQVLGTSDKAVMNAVRSAVNQSPRWQPGGNSAHQPIRTQVIVPVEL